MKKKLLIIAGVVVAVIVIAIVIVGANLDKIINSRKGELLARAKATTGRDIAIGEVGVSWWPPVGARVSDVVISDDPAVSNQAFVTAKDVRINVKLLPLLRKQVEVGRFVLVEPNITVVKLDAKRFNFTSMVEQASGVSPAGPAGGAPPTSAPKQQAAFALGFADIKDGTLHYIDRTTGFDRTIKDIDFEAENVSFDSEMKAKLAAAVFGDEQDVKLDAKVGPIGNQNTPEAMANAPLSASFELDDVTFAELQAFAPPKPGERQKPAQEGTLDAKASLEGTLGEARLEALTADIAAFGAKESNIKLEASGGPFNLLGDSSQVYANANVKGQLSAGPVPLDNVKLAPKDPSKPAPKLGGDVNGSVTFDGNMAGLPFQGEVDATNASYEVPAQLVKKAGVPAKANFKGTFRPQGAPNEGIELSDIDLVVHTIKANGSGKIVPFKGRESMSIAIDAATSLAPLQELLPAMAASPPTGDAKVNVRISRSGPPQTPPNITGTATVSNFGAKVTNVPKPISGGNATITFSGKTASIPNATFAIGKSNFKVNAEVTSFAPMAASYTMTSPEIYRADVQAPAAGAKPMPREEVFRNVTVKGTSTQKAPKVMENNITITSGSGIAANIDYKDAEAIVRATPEQAFIDHFSANAMAGSISGSGVFRPKESKFDVKAKVDKVNLTEYFRYKSPALAEAVAGRISGDIDLAGQGKTWEALQKTLTGRGGAVVLEGALLNTNLTEQLFNGFAASPLVPPTVIANIKKKNPNLFGTNKTMFENLAGKIAIQDGKISTADLKLASNDFSMVGDGYFSFDKTLNLNTTLTLSQKLSNDLVAEIPAAKFLLNANGRFEVPLKLTGAIMKPAVGVDTNAMQARLQQGMVQQGRQEVQKKATDTVKGLLEGIGKKKEPPKTPPAEQPKTPPTTPPPPPDSTKAKG